MTTRAFRLDLRQLVYAIAHAVDLVGVDDIYHGRRVGMLAVECAKQLGFDGGVQDVLFDAGLLHDCGVSSTRAHQRLATELEWDGAQAHCDRGHQLLQDFAPLAHLAPLVLHHHRRWSSLLGMPVDSRVALHSNLIFLVDRVAMLAAPYHTEHILLARGREIRDTLGSYRGSLFAPELVDAFLAISNNEAFWLAFSAEFVQQYQADMATRGEHTVLPWQQFKGCAHIFARIIDAKSPYTMEHSLGVSRLARYLAQRLDLAEERCEMIEVAGLLHDIGKLQIPDEILESPQALSEWEFGIMKSHTFATYHVLKRLGCIDDIARWAGYHHETLDGSGYPFHMRAEEIPVEARIINVADIVQAMAQKRPYRDPLPAEAIVSFLVERAHAGLADARVVQVVADNLRDCIQVATAGGEPG